MLLSLGSVVGLFQKSDAQREQAQEWRAKENWEMPNNTLERFSYGSEAKLAHVDMAVGGKLERLLLSHYHNIVMAVATDPYVFALLSVGTRTSLDLEIYVNG